jgi:hypothetical protein
VFAVDEITDGLERVAEYLNGPVPRGPPHDLSCRRAGPDGTAPVGATALGQRVATLEQAVSSLTASSIAELDDDQIRAELTSVEDVERRLDPRSCRLAAALTDR